MGETQYLHHRNQQMTQIRAVAFQSWLSIISKPTTALQDWGAAMGPLGRTHTQHRDSGLLFPSGIYFHPQTSRTYLRTKKESPELIGTHCSPSSHWAPPPIVLSHSHSSEAPPKGELGGTSWSEPWTPSLSAGGFYCECPRILGFPRPWASQATGDWPVYGK